MMARKAGQVLGFAAAVLITACGGGNSGITIQPDPTEIPADGVSSSEITVTAIFQDQGAPEGTTIRLVASGGSFEADDQVREVDLDTVGGKATATLYAPTEKGQIDITATFTDPYEITHQAQATIMVTDRPAVSGARFDFYCAVQTVGQPVGEEVRVPCTVDATDVNGNKVPVNEKNFDFMAEAGSLELDGYEGEEQLYFVLRPGQKLQDVLPEGSEADGEPRWFDQSVNRMRNPRDGYVTLVVATRGVPTGKDTMLGEPYVDVNDNGQYDPGELLDDADGDGSWTPSGAGTEPRKIWRWAKIVVTGPVSNEAPKRCTQMSLWDPLQVDVDRGGSKTFSVVLVDANLNPVASQPDAGSQDYVEVTIEGDGAEISPYQVPLERNYVGVGFDDVTGELPGRASSITYNRVSHTFTVRNNRTADETGEVPWSVTEVSIQRTLAPGGSTVYESLPPEDAPSGMLK